MNTSDTNITAVIEHLEAKVASTAKWEETTTADWNKASAKYDRACKSRDTKRVRDAESEYDWAELAYARAHRAKMLARLSLTLAQNIEALADLSDNEKVLLFQREVENID